MINVVKHQPPPASLAIEKLKLNGTYRTEDVGLQIQKDFYNKCYICEDSDITSINTEHFVPHKGDINLKFDWDNLFFVCGHCNNTKLAKAVYDNMLNCTNPAHEVTNWIRYSTIEDDGFAKIKVVVEEVVARDGVTPTVTLLNDVYNGEHTINKKMESGNLRKRLHRELAAFYDLVFKFYLDANLSAAEKLVVRNQIAGHLQKPSAFSAFKIWAIRSKEKYFIDFGASIP